ncbi:hypothetical protein SEA_ALTADENA_9 [Arthrobacter phage Altadena]|uniref:Uncharacterized protein n=1 Tax=Arthrobacter phage Altadena TaxID=3059064 RepID=A0AA96KKM2_9CAUD|nr:hypothetical protein SEA_ALTADENA_9 [Arthrobacter phage Altadena]
MATPRKNTATGQDVTPDTTAPDGTTAAAPAAPAPAEAVAASVAPVEPPEPVTAEDARAAALETLLNGSDAELVEVDVPLDYNPDQTPFDFGGRVVCVVTFHSWRALVDGLYKSARKGTLIRVPAAQADRGEALGGLRRVDLD